MINYQNYVPEGSKFYTSYSEFSKNKVSKEKVIEEISKLPLDGILGFLAILSIESIKDKNFYEQQVQGELLKIAIIDDFPESLPNVSEIYVPGHLPLIKDSMLFVHPHNIAWLSHQALLHSNNNIATNNIDYSLKRRICRLLLIVNDYLNEILLNILNSSNQATLKTLRSIIISWLRYWQFSTYQDIEETGTQVAREYKIWKELLIQYYSKVDAEFLKATNQISLEHYFQILTLFIILIYQSMNPEKFSIKKSTFTKNIKANKEEIELILTSWIQTPTEYCKTSKKLNKPRINKYDHPTFEFINLRIKPFIEVRQDIIVCPVMNFLLEKIANGPYFILSDYLQKPSYFQTVLSGNAYEDYTNELITKIAENDTKGKWEIYMPKIKGSELADIYLQRQNIGIYFEHKGGRLSTNFLHGKEEERILGPPSDILDILDGGNTIEIQKIKKRDDSIFTKGIWQQSLNAKKLRTWIKQNIEKLPDKIFPIITHYADVRIDSICRIMYLDSLIKKTKAYNYRFINQPQWLHISDIESLAALADEGNLDLESILMDKSKPNNKIIRFDIFLKRNEKLILNKKLWNKYIEICKEAGRTYWQKEI